MLRRLEVGNYEELMLIVIPLDIFNVGWEDPRASSFLAMERTVCDQKVLRVLLSSVNVVIYECCQKIFEVSFNFRERVIKLMKTLLLIRDVLR